MLRSNAVQTWTCIDRSSPIQKKNATDKEIATKRDMDILHHYRHIPRKEIEQL